ncbi:MAG: Asp-tRNA(Asn)/Glu-tRNA(Gln) amidotransferase subunit GatC [Elusimicrobiota bacterium]|jgi:aspartyl-tRNA(Asn)/glutamyl-tRNA(Gln) amidotransferase subunit C|nr:Asp-tRNA(Asn)/Glu-tRNA(Gln) amidotransferase subunit GatC [Elusimicrobiota bacterium]
MEKSFMSNEELKNTAFMARLDIKDDKEKEKYLKDLNNMMAYIEVLQEPDISNLKPTTHVTKLRNVWRDDIVKPCPQEVREQILIAAPDKEGSFFKVKKVIEAQ